MNENKINVLIKAWETYQNLAKGFGENAWKIRVAGFGFWSAIMGYGYKNSDNKVYLFSLIIVVLFLFLEAGMRQLQYKYINKSINIEKSINDFLLDDNVRFPTNGISTNISTPSINDFFNLFRFKRWLFWLPYIVLLIVTALFINQNIYNS
ncbi:hypothetical protein [Bacillus haynesii]|uniref:hypothetical protein n=1 Tax=Bacillus haynesii TaxID=1925021 RepID=UPI0022810381|nr:hypothetical protein [Bacillus haynesii]MCY8098847.1 hypothetical protein [Bacillus haynesii]MCY8468332.1 hypothetical protein [Bacillus haynesii]